MPTKSTAPGMAIALAAASLLIATAIGAAPATGAPIKPQKGAYIGHTKQTRVLKSARAIRFRVKGRRITLTAEPAVARNLCISAPVFLLDETTVRTKLGRGGRFKFTRTFVGSRLDRISGRFTAPDRIEGEAVYHFRDSDAGLCSAGKIRVRFTAKRKK